MMEKELNYEVGSKDSKIKIYQDGSIDLIGENILVKELKTDIQYKNIEELQQLIDEASGLLNQLNEALQKIELFKLES